MTTRPTATGRCTALGSIPQRAVASVAVWGWVKILKTQKISDVPVYLSLPSGYVKIAIEHIPFIVDFPIKHGDSP